MKISRNDWDGHYPCVRRLRQVLLYFAGIYWPQTADAGMIMAKLPSFEARRLPATFSSAASFFLRPMTLDEQSYQRNDKNHHKGRQVLHKAIACLSKPKSRISGNNWGPYKNEAKRCDFCHPAMPCLKLQAMTNQNPDNSNPVTTETTKGLLLKLNKLLLITQTSE